MRKINLKETGITLIALVVTIIVLLILAGVTISIAISNNGLIGRAGDSKNTHIKESAREQILLAATDASINGEGQISYNSLIDALNQAFKGRGTGDGYYEITEGDSNSTQWTVTAYTSAGEVSEIINGVIISVDSNIISARIMDESKKIYLYKTDGTIVISGYVDPNQPYGEYGEYDSSNETVIAQNVKDFTNHSFQYLTRDNKLWSIGINEPIATDVKESNGEYFLTNNNELYLRGSYYENRWDNTLILNDVKFWTFDGIVNNSNELYSMYSHYISKVRDIQEEIKSFYGDRYITTNDELYRLDTKIANNVKMSEDMYYLTNDNKFYSFDYDDSDNIVSNKIADNVKEFFKSEDRNIYYVTMNNELYKLGMDDNGFTKNKIDENVIKIMENYRYLKNNGGIYELNGNCVNSTAINGGVNWYQTSDGKVYFMCMEQGPIG